MKQSVILLLLLVHTYLFAHPHTFIEVEPNIEIKDEKIQSFHLKWTLDEMTSMMLIMELDSNGDGKFDKEENNYIYENYFSSLEDKNFYMHIDSNKKKTLIKTKEFQASIEKDRLIYSFAIDKKIDIKNLEIDFFDEELFVGMIIEKEYITIAGINKAQQNILKKQIFGVK
jgi:ABC-type uncharacterized transport system substrate-binding protein